MTTEAVPDTVATTTSAGRHPTEAAPIKSGEQRAVPAQASDGQAMTWGPLLVVLAGTFMTILDFFIVNVAVPDVQRDLSATRPEVQLVVAGYGLTFAVGLITGGRLGDLYGRRRLFCVGMALFVLASLGCAIAPSATALIVARLVEGVAAALLVPQVLAILNTLYTGAHRARAFAAYGMVLGMAGVFGQLIGGALIAADPAGLGWRTIFLINIPVGLVALVAVRWVLPESERHRNVSLDLTGSLLLSIGLTLLVFPLVEGREVGWPAWTWASLAAAPAVLGVFAAHQRREARARRDPLLHPDLLRRRQFSIGSAVTVVFLMANGSFFFVLALYLQQARGQSPLASGELFTAVGLGFFLGMGFAAPLSARVGRQILACGAITTAVGFAILALTAATRSQHTVVWLVPGLVVVGVGLGLVLAPLADVVLDGTPTRFAGAAAGVLSTAQELGGALGITIVGVIYYGVAGQRLSAPTGHAFVVSLLVQAGFALLAAVLVQFLAPRRSGPRP